MTWRFQTSAQTHRLVSAPHGRHFMLLPGTAAGAYGHIMAPGCVPLLRLSVRTAQMLKYQRLQETAWTFQYSFFLFCSL